MKSWILVAVLLLACLTGRAELSEDQLEEYEDLIKISSVGDRTEKGNGDEEFEVLEVKFSGGNNLDAEEVELLKDVWFRVAVEITDKSEKKTYFAERKRMVGTFSREYLGNGSWSFEVPCGDIERLKISAYVVQYGVMDGETFIPFDEDCDDVETYEELTARVTTPYPEKTSLSQMIYVSDL